MNILTKIYWSIFLLIGKKLFSYVDIYSPNDFVLGITFTNRESYLNAVGKIEGV